MSFDLVAYLRMDYSDFAQGTKKAQGGLAGLVGTAKKAGVALGAAFAAKKVKDGLVEAGSSAADFSAALTKSFAIQQLTGEQQDRMARLAQESAKGMKFSANEAAEAYFFLASAGLNAEQQMAALPQVLQFAQAGNFDLAVATDLLTDAQSAMGLTVDDAAQNLRNLTLVGDTLIKGNTLANATTQQLSEALTNGAAAASKVAGKDIAETTAVLAAFADQGIKGADAGTMFAMAMRDLQNKAVVNPEEFRAAGINVFDDAGEMRHMADIMTDLEGRLMSLNDESRKSELLGLGFNDKSVKAIEMLLGTSGKIAEFDAKLRSAGGTMKEVSDKSMTPFELALDRAADTWEEFKVSIGAPLLNVATEGLKLITPALESLVNMTRRFIDLVKPFAPSVGLKLGGDGLDKAISQAEKLARTESRAKPQEQAKAAQMVAAAANDQARSESIITSQVRERVNLLASAADYRTGEAHSRIFQSMAASRQRSSVGAVQAAGPDPVPVLHQAVTELRRISGHTRAVADHTRPSDEMTI